MMTYHDLDYYKEDGLHNLEHLEEGEAKLGKLTITRSYLETESPKNETK